MLSGPPVVSTAEQLLDRFVTASARQRRTLLPQLQARVGELLPLIPAELDHLDRQGDDWAAGTLIQLLAAHAEPVQWQSWQQSHAEGWLQTDSAAGLSFAPLQWALVEQQFEQADRVTSELLRQLAGEGAVKRGYVYYSEVPPMPVVDLQAIDRLWVCFSQGRFGFSVQARLLRGCNQRWDQLWPRLGWKQAGLWTRYPGSFTWSLEAPEGHMPLINQLRGVRLMDAVLRHPAIAQRLT
ncbi:MAG: GUN4 domain-containing protein [Cyanobacteria bacterium K_DeepCast_35m_m2_023]|nr:GUN4 domain-containing protein [Cyanobacteria bacterium K_DeepCast_35m_m2_023]